MRLGVEAQGHHPAVVLGVRSLARDEHQLAVAITCGVGAVLGSIELVSARSSTFVVNRYRHHLGPGETVLTEIAGDNYDRKFLSGAQLAEKLGLLS